MESFRQSLLNKRTSRRWFCALGCALYVFFCWGVYTLTEEPVYGQMHQPGIEADSPAYFRLAGVETEQGAVDQGALINFGGSSLGPVVMALVGRNRFGVACLNCLLALVVVWWAGFVPGVSRTAFMALMAIEPQTLPTLMTLNKEILAVAGLVSFAAYLYPEPGSRRTHRSAFFLWAGLLLSLLARWEQILIPLWFLAVEARISPFSGKPWRAILALLAVSSAGWALAVKVLHLNLGGFVVQIEGGGLVTRLYSIQEHGGYFLVALPKILMNIAGRWITPWYFLRGYWEEDFGSNWQNKYVGILSSLVMLCVLAWMFLRGRFRLGRPLVHVTAIYFICTAINPFVQHRYIYPAYALMALELSRREDALEPVKSLPSLPPLPAAYLTFAPDPQAHRGKNGGGLPTPGL